VVLANPLTTKEHLSDILEEQIEIASNNRIWNSLSTNLSTKIA